MKTEPAYFDSQASAASALNISLERLREAKRQGCTAFRSGRVYRDELLDWFEKRPQRSRPNSIATCSPTWKNRRIVIFDLTEFLCDARERNEMTAPQFRKLMLKTAQLVVEVGKIWDADIDEKGFRATCRAIVAQMEAAPQRVN
jgi:hypothetical protein